MIGSCTGLLVSFATFLCSINQEYTRSFVSTKTANEVVQEHFTHNVEDEKRFVLLTNDESKWRPYIGDDVKRWVGLRLQTWLRDEPKRFNDYCKSTIPKWAVEDKRLFRKLSTKELEELKREMRRSSFSIAPANTNC